MYANALSLSLSLSMEKYAVLKHGKVMVSITPPTEMEGIGGAASAPPIIRFPPSALHHRASEALRQVTRQATAAGLRGGGSRSLFPYGRLSSQRREPSHGGTKPRRSKARRPDSCIFRAVCPLDPVDGEHMFF